MDFFNLPRLQTLISQGDFKGSSLLFHLHLNSFYLMSSSIYSKKVKEIEENAKGRRRKKDEEGIEKKNMSEPSFI